MVPRGSESSGGWEALARKDGDMLSCQHEAIPIDDRGFHAAFSIRLRPGILRGNGAGAVSRPESEGARSRGRFFAMSLQRLSGHRVAKPRLRSCSQRYGGARRGGGCNRHLRYYERPLAV